MDLHGAWIAGQPCRRPQRPGPGRPRQDVPPLVSIRNYLDVMGQTPAKAVERIRVGSAACSPERGDVLDQARRAATCGGFGSDEHLRRAFRAPVGCDAGPARSGLRRSGEQRPGGRVRAMAENFDPPGRQAPGPPVTPRLAEEVAAVLEGEANPTARMATVAAMLATAFEAYFWAGFYLVDPERPDELVVGPYQGTLGCLRIAFGRGVCGTAAAERRTVIVPDVDAFPGHIACDLRLVSEIVVPVFGPDGALLGVLDVDSHRPGGVRRGRCGGARNGYVRRRRSPFGVSGRRWWDHGTRPTEIRSVTRPELRRLVGQVVGGAEFAEGLFSTPYVRRRAPERSGEASAVIHFARGCGTREIPDEPPLSAALRDRQQWGRIASVRPPRRARSL